MRTIQDDWVDGLDDNGGSPRSIKKTWLDINWTFPTNAPNPTSFSVVVYTGSDPTDTTKYLLAPFTVPGSDRRCVKAIAPNVSVTGINAAVRADYV